MESIVKMNIKESYRHIHLSRASLSSSRPLCFSPSDNLQLTGAHWGDGEIWSERIEGPTRESERERARAGSRKTAAHTRVFAEKGAKERVCPFLARIENMYMHMPPRGRLMRRASDTRPPHFFHPRACLREPGRLSSVSRAHALCTATTRVRTARRLKISRERPSAGERPLNIARPLEDFILEFFYLCARLQLFNLVISVAQLRNSKTANLPASCEVDLFHRITW